jgi:hypothetical protein
VLLSADPRPRAAAASSDATAFGFAQNKANTTDVLVSAVLSPGARRKLLRSQPIPKAREKIQAICNGKSAPSAM